MKFIEIKRLVDKLIDQLFEKLELDCHPDYNELKQESISVALKFLHKDRRKLNDDICAINKNLAKEIIKYLKNTICMIYSEKLVQKALYYNKDKSKFNLLKQFYKNKKKYPNNMFHIISKLPDDQGEFIQSGYIEICKAVDSYDFEKGKFKKYVNTNLVFKYREIDREFNSNKLKYDKNYEKILKRFEQEEHLTIEELSEKIEVPLETIKTSIIYKNSNKISWEDKKEGVDSPLSKNVSSKLLKFLNLHEQDKLLILKEILKAIEKCEERFPEKYKLYIWNDKLKNGLTNSEIAKKLSVSKNTPRNWEKKGFHELSRCLEDEGFSEIDKKYLELYLEDHHHYINIIENRTKSIILKIISEDYLTALINYISHPCLDDIRNFAYDLEGISNELLMEHLMDCRLCYKRWFNYVKSSEDIKKNIIQNQSADSYSYYDYDLILPKAAKSIEEKRSYSFKSENGKYSLNIEQIKEKFSIIKISTKNTKIKGKKVTVRDGNHKMILKGNLSSFGYYSEQYLGEENIDVSFFSIFVNN